MNELSRMVIDYFKDKDYDIDTIVKKIDDLKIDVVKDYLENSDDDQFYVIKRSGHLELYSADKIARSIKNAADRNDQYLNSSDVDIIMEDVNKSMDQLSRKVYATYEIKQFVKDALLSEGYSKIYDSYSSYIEI